MIRIGSDSDTGSDSAFDPIVLQKIEERGKKKELRALAVFFALPEIEKAAVDAPAHRPTGRTLSGTPIIDFSEGRNR